MATTVTSTSLRTEGSSFQPPPAAPPPSPIATAALHQVGRDLARSQAPLPLPTDEQIPTILANYQAGLRDIGERADMTAEARQEALQTLNRNLRERLGTRYQECLSREIRRITPEEIAGFVESDSTLRLELHRAKTAIRAFTVASLGGIVLAIVGLSVAGRNLHLARKLGGLGFGLWALGTGSALYLWHTVPKKVEEEAVRQIVSRP